MHGVLVVFDVADGFDALPQAAAFGRRGAHAEVVRHRGVDAHGAGVVLCAGGIVFGVHRHEVHAHRRFARLVAAVVAVHRRHPVEHLALRFLARRRAGREPAPDADASGEYTEQSSADDRRGSPVHEGSVR